MPSPSYAVYPHRNAGQSPLRVIDFSLFIFLVPSFFLSAPVPAAAPSLQPARLTQADDAFLEDMERRNFRYFWEQTDAHTGLVFDRAHTDGTAIDAHHPSVASIAATGFGLTALCIAAARHWVSEEDASERVRVTLRFFAERATQEHGWFYHFLDSQTGNEIMALMDHLHSQGNTIVLVTHEHDISEYAHRVIYIRDGIIADDRKTGRKV